MKFVCQENASNYLGKIFDLLPASHWLFCLYKGSSKSTVSAKPWYFTDQTFLHLLRLIRNVFNQ